MPWRHQMTSQPDRPLAEQQLTAIEARATAAPDGPWHLSDDLEGDGYPGHLWVVRTPASGPDEPDEFSAVVSIGNRALGEFVAAARTDVDVLLAEVRRLNGQLEQIRHLHKDSPMGPCPVCIDADAAVAGGDGLVPYPCPTARLSGAQDCEPPHVRAAEEQPAAVAPDTLPAWLARRFDPRGPEWDALTDDDRSYWE